MINIRKPSFYNIIYAVGEEKWLFNTMNLGLIQIDDDTEKILQDVQIDLEHCTQKETDILNELEEAGFIVLPNVNERKVLQYMYNIDKYNKEYLSITILPTLDCNCACYYCFERENEHKTKGTIKNNLLDIEQFLLDFIEKKLPYTKHLSIAWFGGEPLLEFEVIEYLSKKLIKLADKYGITYTASLTTNGFYLTEITDVIKRLKICHIDSYQITLDGAPEDHNQIRKLKNIDSPTFDRMLSGIQLLHTHSLNVSVRINISKRNLSGLNKLFDILEEKGLKKLRIYFGQLIDYSDVEHKNVYLNQIEYAKAVEELYLVLKEREFNYGLDDHYPTGARPCIANRIDSAIIDCYGNIYKCRSQVGEFEKRIGHICAYENQTSDEAIREINWMEWTPFKYDQCKQCKILPLCLGGCPFSLYDNDDALPRCDAWKYYMDFFIKQKILGLEDERDDR